jgi:16S rRNA (uracil1498-N3)-methyltransferase
MRRFFVPPEQSRGDVFELAEREAHHAGHVVRLDSGDELTVLDGVGGVLRCVVAAATKRSVRLAVRERSHHPPLRCAVTLIQAVPKGPAFETIVQKATELGAARIIPLLSERVVTHINERDAGTKVEKWRQIAIESIKQCGSPWLPVIDAPVRFESLMSQLASNRFAELALVCSLEARHRTLRAVAADFVARHQRTPANAAIWIGPEGDFTPAEYAAIGRLGATPITLGPLVLRADTAAIAALSIANSELQDWA